MDLEHEKRLTAVEERAKSNTHRLDELEPIVKEIHNMSATMCELTNEMKHTNQSLEEIKGKVDALEDEPGKKWKSSQKTIWNAILTAVGAAIASGFFYLLTMR